MGSANLREVFVPSPSRKIVVIAPDNALRQSLTFALEVEGFSVEAHAFWCPDDVALSPAACLIIDDQVVRACNDARGYLLDPKHTIILLTDGMSAPMEDNPGVTLAKPFDGADLLQLVRNASLAA